MHSIICRGRNDQVKGIKQSESIRSGGERSGSIDVASFDVAILCSRIRCSRIWYKGQ